VGRAAVGERRLALIVVSGLTVALARACIARGLEEATRLGFKVAVAVVDEAGHLVACERMDGALWVTPEIARAKANAAAGFHASTLDLEERFTKRMLFADNVATLGSYEFVFGRGGMPIVDGGRIVGAVGVSGAVPADNDHAIADAAAGHPTIPSAH
jgi:glc operon protein GlcG